MACNCHPSYEQFCVIEFASEVESLYEGDIFWPLDFNSWEDNQNGFIDDS